MGMRQASSPEKRLQKYLILPLVMNQRSYDLSVGLGFELIIKFLENVIFLLLERFFRVVCPGVFEG